MDVLAVTKLDVLTGLTTLRVATGYRLGERVLDTFTVSLEELAELEVLYEDLEGWEDDISGARSLADLPHAAQKYLARIEGAIGLPISMIGVGPERAQLIGR